MEYFTLRNTAILGLAQVGVIVAGVLAAGATHKMYSSVSARPPRSTAVVAERGHLALALPLAWTALAVMALRRDEDEDGLRFLAFAGGIAMLLLLVFGAVHSSAAPLLRLFGCGGCMLST